MNDSTIDEQGTPALNQWDSLPGDAHHEVDVAAWLTEYRARLDAMITEGRHGRRDRDMLRTMAHLMERSGTLIFPASREDLVRLSGGYYATVMRAMVRLKAKGYVIYHDRDGFCEANTHRDLYSLVMEALPPVPVSESKIDPSAPSGDTVRNIPKETTVAQLVSGDYSHDAFAGRKGFTPNARAVWLHLCAEQGITRAAVSRATGMSKPTVTRAVKWLDSQGLAYMDSDTGTLWALPPNRVKEMLDGIVRRGYLQGKTEQRIEYIWRDWMDVKREKDRKMKEILRLAHDKDRIERSYTEDDLVLSMPLYGA